MQCQHCGQRPATFHLTNVVNGDKTEVHLCEACAKQQGNMLPGMNDSFSIHDLMSDILNFSSPQLSPQQTVRQAKPRRLCCSVCGMTFEQFSKVGRLGCAECYKAFGERLTPILKRIHGNTVHIGKTPRRLYENKAVSEPLVESGKKATPRKNRIKDIEQQVAQLKQELTYRINREEFEAAAKLRDQIIDLEKER